MRRKKVAISWFSVWQIKNPTGFVSKRNHTLQTLWESLSEFRYFPCCHTDVKEPLAYSPKDLPFTYYSLQTCPCRQLKYPVTSWTPLRFSPRYWVLSEGPYIQVFKARKNVVPCPQTAFLLRLNLHPCLFQLGFL